MFIKPVAGRLVRIPGTKKPVPAAGINVPDTSIFWARRVRDGDVVVSTAPVLPTVAPVIQGDAVEPTHELIEPNE